MIQKMGKQLDITNKRYGKLVAIKRNGTYKHGGAMWKCICDCGNEYTVWVRSLVSGKTRSCGCFHRESVAKLKKLPNGQASFNEYFGRAKRAAEYRGYSWNLTKEQVKEISSRRCYYCGASPQYEGRKRITNGRYKYNGIDRVNNNLGYFWENVVPCCYVCNKAKHTMNKNEFLSWIKRVYEKQFLNPNITPGGQEDATSDTES